MQIPIGLEADFAGVIDLIRMVGLKWHAGIEQKRIAGKDYPGLFFGLQYNRQPQLLKDMLPDGH